MTPSGTRARAPRGRSLLLVGGVALALTLAGCGGSGKTASGTVIGITERDFHIATTTTHVNAGRVTLTGIVSDKISPDLAEGGFHEAQGWVIFMVAFAILVVFHQTVIRVAAMIERRKHAVPV